MPHPASCRPRGLLLAALAALPGCCPLAQYFCGPDDSRWVSEAFATPAECVDTFLEAVRRDARGAIYRSLSDGFKRRNGLPGELEASIAWERIKRQQPGVHLLGAARPLGWMRLGDDLVRYELAVYGRRFEIDVARQAYVSVIYAPDQAPGVREASGAFVPTLRRYVLVQPDDERTVVTLSIPDLDLPEDIDVDDLRQVTAGYDWKIEDLRQIE